MAQYTVENVEPNRVILVNPEDRSYVTVAIHDDDKDGLEGLKDFKPGDKINVTLEVAVTVDDPNRDQFKEEEVPEEKKSTEEVEQDFKEELKASEEEK